MNNSFLDEYFKKKKRAFSRGLILLLGVVLLIFLFKTFLVSEKDYIAKLNIGDVIINNDKLVGRLNELEKDPNVKGLLVSINSPGGTVVSSQKIFNILKDLGDKIPVVVSMKEVAASGGYMVAIAAEKIFCFSGTITGSVGVILQSANIEGLLTKIGVKPVIFKSGNLKSIPNPAETIQSEGQKSINEVIKIMHEEFLQLVIKERNLTNQSHIDEISQGGIFTGNQAKKLNLVDDIGDEKDAINWLKNRINSDKELEIITIEEDSKLYEFMNISYLKKFFTRNTTTINGIFALWAPNYE